jgi:hypothetical protein
MANDAEVETLFRWGMQPFKLMLIKVFPLEFII